MRDPELVARAGYAAARLEQAWERWRALHGLGGSSDPLASYVGYSLKASEQLATWGAAEPATSRAVDRPRSVR
jgi:hypothetical protein